MISLAPPTLSCWAVRAIDAQVGDLRGVVDAVDLAGEGAELGARKAEVHGRGVALDHREAIAPALGPIGVDVSSASWRELGAHHGVDEACAALLENVDRQLARQE